HDRVLAGEAFASELLAQPRRGQIRVLLQPRGDLVAEGVELGGTWRPPRRELAVEHVLALLAARLLAHEDLLHGPRRDPQRSCDAALGLAACRAAGHFVDQLPAGFVHGPSLVASCSSSAVISWLVRSVRATSGPRIRASSPTSPTGAWRITIPARRPPAPPTPSRLLRTSFPPLPHRGSSAPRTPSSTPARDRRGASRPSPRAAG